MNVTRELSNTIRDSIAVLHSVLFCISDDKLSDDPSGDGSRESDFQYKTEAIDSIG